ncbi:MAG TPA: glutathione S-transferase family protein [Polyangiaceae bacterium]|nr:glutathione S-transferase family protein [Polyangiaceae bacterium]
MHLYYFETLNPRKACAVAKYVNAPVEYVLLDIRKMEQRGPSHIARNPNGRVPVLVTPEKTLWESLAIMVYLASKAKSPLWPEDPLAQAEVLRWASFDAFHVMPRAGVFYFERYIKPMLGLGAPDEQAIAKATPLFHQSAKVLDAHLADQRWVAGDALSIADFCLAATLPQADAIGLPLEPYANVRKWHDRLLEIDAWRDPWPAKA